jgi:hypothetical protein
VRTVAALVVVLTTMSAGTAPAVADDDGFVPERRWKARQDEFLELATESLDAGSVTNVIAHAARADRERGFEFDAGSVTTDDFARSFEKIDTFADTADFDLLYLTNLWYGYRDALEPELREAIEARMRDFKHWYTEPTPPGVVDNRYYWSENHRIIFHTIEYLAGAAFPDDGFTNDGRDGAVHRDEARRRILDWLDEKVRFGWSEWHSDVYYQKDATPLLTLVEFAPDRKVADRAAMVLDLLLLDLAQHLQQGNFGASRGRSYMKDKSVAVDQDTFGMAKLLFEDTTEPYPSTSDAGAVLFARAERYRLPEVLRRIATSDEVSVDRQRMGVPLDPQAPIEADVEAPYGYDFDDPENVPFWWERGAQPVWQTVETTIETLDQYGLWESAFFSPFAPLRDAVGGDPETARSFARELAPMLGFGLLTEVNSYTYRAPEVMLSTAQDHRFGMFSEQAHAWQATFDERALVFTTHPKNEPEVGTEWPDGDGYWTGTGSMPSSAQHRTASVHVYDPAFDPPGGGPLGAFDYIDSTHAYLPQEHFDEVVTDGHWVFARKGDGYLGLWSEREPRWREPPPGTFTHGLTQPFDLVAEGGPDNVWIAEVGRRADAGTFQEFRDALRSAPVEVGETASGITQVTFASPSQGRMVYEVGHGEPGKLAVAGEPVRLRGYPRFDTPWVEARFQARRYVIEHDDARLELDFDEGTRSASK